MEMKYGGGRLKFTLGSEGEAIGKRLYAIDVVVKESVKIESGKVVMVRVGWERKSLDTRRMVYVNGEKACYKVRRVTFTYDAIMN